MQSRAQIARCHRSYPSFKTDASHRTSRKVKKRAARFTILNDTLYKRGFSMPYLKCVDEEEAKFILEVIHKGVCSDYAGSRSLVSKVIKIGYF